MTKTLSHPMRRCGVLFITSLALGFAFWTATSGALRAQEDLVTEDLRIPLAAAGPTGLEAVLVKPAGTGRHPLAIISHGSPRSAEDRPGMTARSMMPQLIAFAHRGFVAVSVLRRGYGTSAGGWAETFGPCNTPDYAAAGRAGAADLKTSIAVLAKRTDVDPSRILAVGVSAGGFATVALSADPPPGLVAAISFAGGRGSSGPDQVCGADQLVNTFAQFGSRSRIPMLWVYAQNDHFFGPPLAHRLVTAFNQAGGHASFVQAAAYGADGHGLFSAGGQSIWLPIVEPFLDAQGFKSKPDVSTAKAPALEPPHQLNAGARRDFQAFIDAPSHKAFAVSSKGGYGWRTARGTQAEANQAALQQCQAAAKEQCQLYAVDNAYAK